MKRFLKITGIVLLILFIIFLLSTSSVKRTSFFNEDYYKITAERIDSLKKSTGRTSDKLKAGFASVSITPSIGNPEDDHTEGRFIRVSLAGYGDRKGKPATGIHDSIFVKAIAMETGGKTIVFVGADLLIVPPNITDQVVADLSERGILREQLFFSATHTHSSVGGWGPGFIAKQFAGEENKEVQKWLVNQITKAVVLAMSDLKPAWISCGNFNAGAYTRNRTSGESGTRNNDFSFIIFEQEGGRRGVLGSFAAHSTTLGGSNMEVSADYPGYWARRLESTSAGLALFFAGSTGSQSPVTRGEGFEKSRFLGESLADSLNSILEKTELYDSIEFSAVSLKVTLPDYHIRLTTKTNLSEFWSRKLMPEPSNVCLQAIRINDMVWITTPCDFSGEYALQLKTALAAEGFSSNVTSFNGSYVGYIIPGRYFYVDGYESRLMSWFGPEMGDYTMELIRQISRIVTGSDNL